MAALLSKLKSSAKYEPVGRAWHISQCVGGKVLVQGGRTMDFSEKIRQHLSSVVEVFAPYSELWEQKQVEGDGPEHGTYIAASVSLHDDLFTFGGFCDGNYSNTLHKLDTKTWSWHQVSPQNADGAPMPKAGCGMTALKDKLGFFGAHGMPQGPTEPQSFMKNTRYTDGRGWTNEFHIYNLSEGVWSCPTTTGDTPPPCSGFTFTAVDDRRSVLFGGRNKEIGGMNFVYIIDFLTMTWSKLSQSEGDSWPDERTSHAACCLNYGQQYPQLLVTGGRDMHNNPLADAWVLDVEGRQWTRVTGTHKRPRWAHSLTAYSLGPGLTEVMEFGGSSKPSTGSDVTQPKLADTTLLQFMLVQGDGYIESELISVIQSKECGSQERMIEKLNYEIKKQSLKISQLESERESARAEKQKAKERARETENEMKAAQLDRDLIKLENEDAVKSLQLLKERNEKERTEKERQQENVERLQADHTPETAETRLKEVEEEKDRAYQERDLMRLEVQAQEKRAVAAEERIKILEAERDIKRENTVETIIQHTTTVDPQSERNRDRETECRLQAIQDEMDGLKSKRNEVKKRLRAIKEELEQCAQNLEDKEFVADDRAKILMEEKNRATVEVEDRDNIIEGGRDRAIEGKEDWVIKDKAQETVNCTGEKPQQQGKDTVPRL